MSTTTNRAGQTGAVEQLATFFVAGEMFGVDVRDVQEVLVAQTVKPITLAPPYVVGLTNLRGQILPAFDLRTRFGMPKRENGPATSNLVVKMPEGPVSLVVDEIGDVIQIPASAGREVPETVPASQRHFLKEIVPLEGRLILRLDLARVFEDEGRIATAEGARAVGGDR
jgi:purine-binding chemotaxis protein CheW